MQSIIVYSIDFIFDFLSADIFVYVLAALLAFVLVNFINILIRRKSLW